MHVVINSFGLQEDVDWQDLEFKVEQFQARLAKERADFHGVSLVRISPVAAIFLVFFETREALDEISKTIAAPWFAENVRPYLDGPVDRQVGEVVSGYLK